MEERRTRSKKSQEEKFESVDRKGNRNSWKTTSRLMHMALVERFNNL